MLGKKRVALALVGVGVGVAGFWVARARAPQPTIVDASQPPTIRRVQAEPVSRIDLGDRPRGAVAKAGIPTAEGCQEEPTIFFPGAEVSDHDESADGEDYGQRKGESCDPGPTDFLPGTDGGIRGRMPGKGPSPGCNDAIGVGGGSGSEGRYGGRRAPVARHEQPEAPLPSPNPTHTVESEKLSTFAVDVDTASYTFARRCLREGSRPAPGSVRVEEFVNYFTYAYPAPTAPDRPFSVSLEATPSPFAPGKHLLRIGLQGKRITPAERKPARLTFLVDTSGSMHGPDRLGLVQQSLKLLVKNLQPTDSVAICTYAGSVREILRPTGIEDEARILAAIDSLTASGSTAMASGIELAYRLADANFVAGAVNRIIVCSDGDANVGPTSSPAILSLIKEKVAKGITLTTMGVGCGNYKDQVMEQLADKGNGHYVYVDSLKQARRVFKEQLAGTLQVIAKDVKIQVELHPDAVASWRLVGYENRHLENHQFRDDKVDAGEIGSGHSVTALYELVLRERPQGPLATVRVRHKTPDAKLEDAAVEHAFAIGSEEVRSTFSSASPDLRFAVAAAGLAEVLRESPAARGWSLAKIHEIAAAAANNEEREELLTLAQQAMSVTR